MMRRTFHAASVVASLMTATGCRSPASRRVSSALTPAVVTYYHQTYAPGPTLTTDGGGQLVEERRTEPFGAPIDSFYDGAVHPVDYERDPVNALGQLSDADTGWSHHGARWLAPDSAQWHTPDPPATAPDPRFMMQPWSLNPYQYVLQNPVLYWDPDGREPVTSRCVARNDDGTGLQPTNVHVLTPASVLGVAIHILKDVESRIAYQVEVELIARQVSAVIDRASLRVEHLLLSMAVTDLEQDLPRRFVGALRIVVREAELHKARGVDAVKRNADELNSSAANRAAPPSPLPPVANPAATSAPRSGPVAAPRP